MSATFHVRTADVHDRFEPVIIHARSATLQAAALAVFVLGFTLAACSTTTDAPAGPSCTNGTKDDGEEGVDCGGVCPLKCTGSTCAVNTECGSGQCNMTACAAPVGKTCGVGAPIPLCTDGQTCELDKDCTSGFCSGSTCATPAAGSHGDGVKNGGETGIDCGGSVKATQPCPDGQGCTDSADCVGTCTAGVCGPISHMDGKKNLDETDVDCGGPSAPKCADGKDCGADGDCETGYCPADTKKCIAPTYSDGVQNGTETDLDCGGTGMGSKPCAQGLSCKVDTDCNGACNYLQKCVDMPSCKNHHGGDTCGTNEEGSGAESHLGPGSAVAAGHEDCCRTLEVTGYTDPVMPPGKTKVYLDKYEITAGRMRAFLEAIGGGVDAAGNAKDPNVKAYMAAHPPSRWSTGWENVLPADNTSSTATYVVKDVTVDLQYPGQDWYFTGSNNLYHRTQNTWWIRATGPTDTAQQGPGQQGTYTVATNVFYVLNAGTMMPEYYANPANWPPPNEGEGYAVAHALNCSNQAGDFGWSTYWFDNATIHTYGGDNGVGKFPGSKDLLDEKAMNCSPNALFAAFCAWDGGQLADADVIDAITGNTVSPIYDSGSDANCQGGAACQGGKLSVGKSTTCAGNTLNVFGDGTQGCYSVFQYTTNNTNNTYDDTGKIAAPGRVLADTITKTAGDEPWMDLIGNLQEAVLKKGETNRFDYRGYGVEWQSIQHHHAQQTTPRFKGGAFGARCMRFR
ncbi:MAG: hypothetical protein QOI41_5077 [Myxococcales bacterium]|nr:hypothetical protein [Myxococcales bacterium]